MASMNKAERAERDRIAEEARAELREMFPPGSRVPMVVRDGHVTVLAVMPGNSNSGGKPYVRNITYLVAKAVPGWRISDKTGGINLRGAPTRIAFHCTYTLGHALYPNGFTVDQASGCYGRNSAKDGDHDPDGGYSIRADDL